MDIFYQALRKIIDLERSSGNEAVQRFLQIRLSSSNDHYFFAYDDARLIYQEAYEEQTLDQLFEDYELENVKPLDHMTVENVEKTVNFFYKKETDELSLEMIEGLDNEKEVDNFVEDAQQGITVLLDNVAPSKLLQYIERFEEDLATKIYFGRKEKEWYMLPHNLLHAFSETLLLKNHRGDEDNLDNSYSAGWARNLSSKIEERGFWVACHSFSMGH